MCGIAGIIRFDRADAGSDDIEPMIRSLAHRGPDGEGVVVRGNLALGNRRLAIIDLATGDQPIGNEDGSVWVTFNGELYNYRELRAELASYGHTFRSRSDTETIVHAYEQWGDDCVNHFRGMFAFGIADLKRGRVFLARDHLGIKPLYYVHTPAFFAFASELAALRRIPDASFTVDVRALDQYLWLQYIPAPRTIFREAHKLAPAHSFSVTINGARSEPRRYWSIDFEPDFGPTENEWLEQLDTVLRESVRAHLVADVRFGAFLSGGLDSSAIVAYMAAALDRPVKTFTIGFQERAFSEIEHAQRVADRWQTEHHVEVVAPDALRVLPDLVRHYGEPFGDSSALPTYFVSRLARASVPMVLSGDGGDELFAGYDTYGEWTRWLNRTGWPLWKKALRPLAQRVAPERYPAREPSLANWLWLNAYTPTAARQQLWRPEYASACGLPIEAFVAAHEKARAFAQCSAVQYLDLQTYLPNDILTKIDVASMMHGLEVRTPLVDRRVVEFCARIPEAVLVAGNGHGDWTAKRLLKKLLAKYYPADMLRRPKQGFAAPLVNWFAPGGSAHGMISDRLLAADSTLADYFMPAAVARIIERNESHQIWLLLFLDEWLRQQAIPACSR